MNSFGNTFGETGEKLRRSTVQVRVDGGRAGQGSGVVWDSGGHIVSNAHVVTSPKAEVELWDGRRYRAEVLRRDPGRDLALLRVGAPDLPVPEWGDSSRLRAGELVLAIGNPLGFVGALSTGVVHAVGPFPGLGRKEWVQASVRLAPGNSGGALAEASGKVIGINTMVVAGRGAIGLAVPSNEVKRFVERVEDPGAPKLGVSVETVPFQLGSQLATGLRIQQISPGSKAESASLKIGDVIIGIDGKFLDSPEDLLERMRASGVMKLEFLRGGRPVPREVAIAIDGLNDDRRYRNAS